MRRLVKNSLAQALVVVAAIELVATTAGADRTMATTVNDGLMALLDRDLGNPVSDVVAKSIRGGANLACGASNACGEWDTEVCEWLVPWPPFGMCGEKPCYNFETGTEYVKGNGITSPCGGSCSPLMSGTVICGS